MNKQKKIKIKILIIDDDEKMIKELLSVLSGLKIQEEGFELECIVDFVEVKVIKKNDNSGLFEISNNTFTELRNKSNYSYNYIFVDFGFVDDEVKKILWGDDHRNLPTMEEVEGRIYTIKDLAYQYSTKYNNDPNLFKESRHVLLRSFVSNYTIPLFGPVLPNRLRETKAAFYQNAEVETFDPRNEIYCGDKFYNFYEPHGRDFYRQLVGFHYKNVMEKYALRIISSENRKIKVRKSLFNIASFSGLVALIGGGSQFLSVIGLSDLTNGNNSGFWWIGSGLLVFIVGTISIAFKFEMLSRNVINFVEPDDER